MFDILIILVFLSPWLYFIGFVIYFISQFSRGRKLPVRLVIVDVICMALLLLLFAFIYTENLALIYEYTHPATSSNDLIGNMYVKSINLAFVIAAFFLFQLCFMIYFSKELKKLRESEQLPHRQEGDIF